MLKSQNKLKEQEVFREDERETFRQSANIWDIIMGMKEETCPMCFSNYGKGIIFFLITADAFIKIQEQYHNYGKLL